jgi:hypothetical protein
MVLLSLMLHMIYSHLPSLAAPTSTKSWCGLPTLTLTPFLLFISLMELYNPSLAIFRLLATTGV